VTPSAERLKSSKKSASITSDVAVLPTSIISLTDVYCVILSPCYHCSRDLVVSKKIFDDRSTEKHIVYCVNYITKVSRHSVRLLRFHYVEGLQARGYRYVGAGSDWCNTEKVNSRRKYILSRDTFENTREVLLIFIIQAALTKERVLVCDMFRDFMRKEVEDFRAHLAIGSESEDDQLGARESFNGFPIFVIYLLGYH
jgi:hypothetical protein